MSDRTLQQLRGYWSQKLDSEHPRPARPNPSMFIEDSFVVKPACCDVILEEWMGHKFWPNVTALEQQRSVRG